MLLRPLPVKDPEQLYNLTRHSIGFDGKPTSYGQWAYPAFRRMRGAAKDQAELIAISYTLTVDLTYQSDQEMEKANLESHPHGGNSPMLSLARPASEEITSSRSHSFRRSRGSHIWSGL